MPRAGLSVRFLLVIAATGLLAAGVFGTAAAPPSSVAELRQKVVAFAGGQGAFEKVHSVSFDFVSMDPQTKARRVHHHAYDRDKGVWRYACTLADLAKTPFWNKAAGDRWTPDPKVPKGKELVAIFDHYPQFGGTVYIDGRPQSGELNTRLLERVRDSIDNDRYWMFLPFIIESPAVRLDPVPPVNEKGFGRLSGFTAYSGANKATNRTLWTLYVTPKGELVRTDIQVLRSPGPVTVLWRKWQQFGPVRIALEHFIPKMNRTFYFEHVTVNRPVETGPPHR